jgi:hypothetical protein
MTNKLMRISIFIGPLLFWQEAAICPNETTQSRLNYAFYTTQRTCETILNVGKIKAKLFLALT